MDFDIRFRDFTFKRTFSAKPDLNSDRYKEHFHTTYELLYLIQGDADFMVKHTLYKIRPGSLLIAKPGEYHNIVLHSQQPYDRFVIRFDPQNIYSYARKQLEKVQSVYYIAGSPLSEEFFNLERHISYVQKEIQIGACIGAMNIIVAYLISSQNLIQQADYVNEDVKKIVEYLESHLPQIHTAQDISNALHMSKSAVYKTFSKQFDTSLMSYIRTQKCMTARQMLADGASATDVANHLGFNHYSSFYRDYMQIFHEPPTGGDRR